MTYGRFLRLSRFLAHRNFISHLNAADRSKKQSLGDILVIALCVVNTNYKRMCCARSTPARTGPMGVSGARDESPKR